MKIAAWALLSLATLSGCDRAERKPTEPANAVVPAIVNFASTDLHGAWAENGDCEGEAVKFESDGSWQLASAKGPQKGTWKLEGDTLKLTGIQLDETGAGSSEQSAVLSATSRDQYTLTYPEGVDTWERCPA